MDKPYTRVVLFNNLKYPAGSFLFWSLYISVDFVSRNWKKGDIKSATRKKIT